MLEPTLFDDAELGHGRELPRPQRERFEPLRAGILNLWQYDEQEFRLEGGRLILRGENGSGKSKALELLLPFVLDADLSPRRLDPFTAGGRNMEWNLLEEGRYASRLGYVWLEFGALGEGGAAPTYVTLGCGLRATESARRVDAWYFVTDLRVGEGLSLTTHRAALSREQLRQALGERGAIYDVAREYRERVDGLLYGLGEVRFTALRELMLKLRRPHLSEKLNPEELSKLVGESLPPIDLDLVGQVAEGFERLDHDETEAQRIEAAAGAVAAFLEVYTTYAKGVVRARAAEVRQADSRYHKAAGEARQVEAERAARAGEVEALAAAHREREGDLAACRGRVRALESSEAMRQAENLRAKEEHALSREDQAAQEERDRERDHAAERERARERDEAEGRAGAAARRAEEVGERARAQASAVGLAATHAEVEARLAAEPERAPAAAEAVINERERSAAELTALAGTCGAAARHLELALATLSEVSAQARAAAERTAAARARAEGEREALGEALAGWLEGLRELALDAAEREELALLLGPEGGEVGDLSGAIADLAGRRRQALVAARTRRERELEDLRAREREVEAEHRALAAARHLPPEPPRTRSAEREGRPGAPLYLLCDFEPGLAPAARAGLEAALEAAGLLDAWVSPEGHLLAPDTLDTVLRASPLADGPTLADWLLPLGGHGVRAEVVRGLLGSIAVDGGEGGQQHRVGPDGTFRLGPLSGAWAKGEAEHIGAAAREAARQRRLAELASRLAELADASSALAAEVRALDARMADLDAERRRAPSSEALRQALAGAAGALAEEGRRKAELAEAEARAGAARAAHEEARARLLERARALALSPFVEDLAAFRRGLDSYRHALRELAERASAAAEALLLERRAAERLAAARAQREEAERRARVSRHAAAAAVAEFEALRATVGKDVDAVLALLKAEGESEKALAAEVNRLVEEREGARVALAKLEERAAGLAAVLAERDADRGHAVSRFERLGTRGVLACALPGEPPEPAPPWSLTRSLELARAVEGETGDVELSEPAANRRANRMHLEFQTLTAALGGDYAPGLEQEDELQIVRFLHDSQAYDPPGLHARLRAEAEERRALLLERERRLLRQFLASEVGDHLRRRLREARELVKAMNDKLAEAPTGSGMRLRLSWQADEEALPAVRGAVELLQRDRELLSDEEQARLEGFFAERIEAARRDWEAVPWREYLGRALDYRLWHRFKVLRRMSGEKEWQELTSRRHAASSGGEKAVSLHLPLFAAAAAHYASARATAPRLIVLDEAFAGIDEAMRGRLMGLLVDFDLDFVMTSYDEWGTYQELPRVAVYQLYRDPDQTGVAAVRFVWDGKVLHEEGQ